MTADHGEALTAPLTVTLAPMPTWWRAVPVPIPVPAGAEGAGRLFLCGFPYSHDDSSLYRALVAAGEDPVALSAVLAGIDGHFALVFQTPSLTVAAVDRVRSYPLAFAQQQPGEWAIDPIGGRLAEALGLSQKPAAQVLNPTAALSLAMAGYTIGADSLYRDIATLVPGEMALFRAASQAPQRVRYDYYRAWEVQDRPLDNLRQTLADVTLQTLEKLIARAGGRTIVVPLSAGLDSRLIVSGLAHLGYQAVKCFSYGLPGNYEAQAAQAIAARLGYQWRFVPQTPGSQRRFFASEDHRAYVQQADCLTGSPFEQDMAPVLALKREGWIPPDAIMVNGNSGDFISGAHVLGPLQQIQPQMTAEQRLELITATLVKKHFRLWSSLATPERDEQIKARLRQEIIASGADLSDPHGAHGIYEFCEFQDRQCKYVISGERIYEHLGLEWALPLWDCAYLDFWQHAPLSAKVGQSLYRQMLEVENWGGVWGPQWTYARTIVPRWIRLPRLALKAAHLPLGAERWHAFERRYLLYWMETMAGQAVVPYRRVISDQRGARHAVAWHTEAYLRLHRVGWDGSLPAFCEGVL